ncbi:MAG: tetratricopeptide repeat protein [Crocinitomicaceae bacterium]|nr:tetratricopeptide repeat protein [Crocinitomicaceae bacterium]
MIQLIACLLCLILCGSVQYSFAQTKSIEELNLEDLSEEDCLFLDSCLRSDNSMSDSQRIEYFASMQVSHESRSNYSLALYCSEELVQLYEKNNMTYELAEAYRDKSMIHDFLGQYPEALNCSQEGLRLFIEIGNKVGEANSYNDIGVLHYYSEDYEKSKEYLNKSFELFKELKDTAGIAMYYNNMANTFFDTEDLSTALKMYQKALEFDLILGDRAGQCITLSNIGETYTALGEYDKAEKNLLEALVIAEDINDPWSETNPLRGLGGLYQETGEYHKAVRVLERNVKICKEIEALPELSQNYDLLYNLYKTQGDYKRALDNFEQYKYLNDSIFNMEKERIMDEMEVKYQLEDKAREIDLITQEKQIAALEHEKELESEQTKQYLLSGGLLGFAVILFFAIRGMIMKKRANEKLQEQNTIIQNKNEEIHSAYLQIEEKNNEILDSIRYAKRIQFAILPPKARIDKLLPKSFILYEPKDVVAGDFYWLEEKNGITLFAAADCTGHGVPGAMVSVVCNNGLNRSVREHGLIDPGEILTKTREIVLDEFGKSDKQVNDGMDIALCALHRTSDTHSILKYAGAHNPLWINRKGSDEMIEIKANKQPIGKYIDTKPFDTHEIEVYPGDTIYIFSDGYADQFGGDKGKKMKTGNFKKLLLSAKDMEINQQKNYLVDSFDKWKGQIEQLDDVCVIGVRI